MHDTFTCITDDYIKKVLGATLDGNSVNRRLIKMHKPRSNEVIYKVTNRFAPDKWPLYFFSDPPHLIKTGIAGHRYIASSGYVYLPAYLFDYKSIPIYRIMVMRLCGNILLISMRETKSLVPGLHSYLSSNLSILG